MRKFVILMAATAGLGLMAASGASAAPVGAAAIDAAANAVSAVQDVRGGGWHCPPARCWRWKCVKVWKPRPKPRRCCY
jgi:hypothetical protein